MKIAYCNYSYLHAIHTPCGKALQEMNDCRDRHGSPQFNLATDMKDLDNDPCFPIFATKFFPCYQKLESHPYYYVRSNMLFGLGTKNLFRVWFDVQKFNALNYLHFKQALE